jgi:hypothetical protein
MAYDTTKLTKLAGLKALAEQAKANDDLLAGRIKTLEDVGSQANVIEGVKVNGALLTLTDKIADILIAEGTTNGTISANGVDIAVHGLAALAYKANVSEDELAEALKNKINAKANQSDLDTLTGTGDGSISKMIDAAFNDFSTKVTDDGVVNSYKELIDWAAEHGGEAATMAGEISSNTTAISDLKKFVGELPEGATATTVTGYIAEAIAALSIGDYVTTEALTETLKGYVTSGTLTTELAKKVDKVEGKGLSTNDYTDTEKTKLAGIAEGATKVEGSSTNGNLKINGVDVTVYTEPENVVHGEIATDTEVTEMLAEVFKTE